jgi:hypothetical protein
MNILPAQRIILTSSSNDSSDATYKISLLIFFNPDTTMMSSTIACETIMMMGYSSSNGTEQTVLRKSYDVFYPGKYYYETKTL